jgi:hypothetical protein
MKLLILEKHLEFIWDNVAKLASIYGRDEPGKMVETVFDLNGSRGRKELIAHRSGYIKKLLALLHLALDQPNNPNTKQVVDILEESCLPNAEYSAFARAHIHPHLQKLRDSQI